jgi:hypothetical protein
MDRTKINNRKDLEQNANAHRSGIETFHDHDQGKHIKISTVDALRAIYYGNDESSSSNSSSDNSSSYQCLFVLISIFLVVTILDHPHRRRSDPAYCL